LASEDVRFIPMSALQGDMIVDRGERLDWYDGPTLLEILETRRPPTASTPRNSASRCSTSAARRIPPTPNCTTIAASWAASNRARSAVGDAVTVLPSGGKRRVKDIQVLGESLARARRRTVGDPAARRRDRHLARRHDRQDRRIAEPVKQIDAMLCWLSESRSTRAASTCCATPRATARPCSPASTSAWTSTRWSRTAERLAMNDIARVSFKLAQPIFADRYAESRGTGAFIVIDESPNNTVGAGMIVCRPREKAKWHSA
jgi:sulfate adenylyltransferase subunit 1